MDTNGMSPVPQARAQPSIRSFFQPQSPNYAPPPGATATATRQPQQAAIPLAPQPPQSSPSQPIIGSKLPPEATISPITEPHIQPLRRINSLLLPIPYPDSFYHAILATSPHPTFFRIITWTSSPSETKVIGGLVSRLEAIPSSPNTYEIYIQSLALLSPYRGKGLATAVLDDVIAAATREKGVRIESVYAHVWTENEEALEWYSKRGFSREQNALAGYYRKLKPDSAFVLRRRISTSDHLKTLPTQTPIPQLGKAESEPTPVEKRPNMGTARSFQDKGPEREWNDLPEDVLGNGLLRPGSHLSTPGQGSAASSRSSSRSGTGGKKKRVYPAAAFGS